MKYRFLTSMTSVVESAARTLPFSCKFSKCKVQLQRIVQKCKNNCSWRQKEDQQEIKLVQSKVNNLRTYHKLVAISELSGRPQDTMLLQCSLLNLLLILQISNTVSATKQQFQPGMRTKIKLFRADNENFLLSLLC